MLFLKPCKQSFENRLRVEGWFPHCRGQYSTTWLSEAYMKKKSISRAGSEEQYGPRLVGEILHDYLENSNEPFAVAYREHTAEAEEEDDDRLFLDVYPNTELGVDLKLMTREPGRMPVGEYINGALTRDSENHFLFVQNPAKERVAARRNPRIYEGTFVNVIRRADGSLILTFNRPAFTEDFTFRDFCLAAAQELLTIVGLVEEEGFEQ